MEQVIKIAAKMYRCRDAAKSYCKIQGSNFHEKVKEYTEIIDSVMKKNKLDHIAAILEISKTKTYQNSGVIQMWFMAAVTETMEPTKPE